MQTKTGKMTAMAMLCAVAYVVMLVGRIPVVLFLKYDPKDVIITIGGFLFGPLSALIISVVVSLVEMLTVSDTGPIGLVMNILASCAFACTAAFIYKKNRTAVGAGIGLIAGCILATIVMMLWNYLMVPLYMGVPREKVVELLIPVFLPFNLLKGMLNGAFAMLLYKPVVMALRKSHLVPASASGGGGGGRKIWPTILSGLVLVTTILLLLVFMGII